MKPSLLLFDIIKSLSQEEKAIFLKSSSLQQGDKNYKKLFSYLDSVTEYNEEKIKQHFKKETFAKHLASEKNQLFHHILKSLRLQRIKDKNGAAVFDKIKDVHLLYVRALPKLADKEAEKVRYRANEDELLYTMILLNETQLNHISSNNYNQVDFTARVKELFEEKKEFLLKISALNKYQQLYDEIKYYFNQNILVHDRSKKHLLESFLNNPLISDLSHANTKRSLLLATFCRLICFRIIRENDKLGLEINNAVELFQKHDFLKKEYPKIYIGLYGFLARYLAITANLTKARAAIDHVRALKDDKFFQTNDLQNTIFTRLSVFNLMFYNYSGQFEKANKLLEETEKNLELNKDQYPGHEFTTINFLMFVTYFSLKNYNKALKCINEIVNSDFDESRQDLFRYAKLCNLIVHYELGNTDYLVYSYKSTLRFFKQIDYPFEYETAFLTHFKSIAISKKRPESKKIQFEEFRDNLEEIFKDPYQMIASEYFDLVAWIDSKINETEYADEIIKRRSNQA